MTKGVKGFQKGHKHSEETKVKIGLANRSRIEFNCEHCGKLSDDQPSSYNRKKRHYCSQECYSEDRKTWPKEQQHRYGTGFNDEERQRRVKCRSDTNHAIRDGVLVRQPCEVCGEGAEAHHDDYDKPYDVRWLCFIHHRQHHKELLEDK